MKVSLYYSLSISLLILLVAGCTTQQTTEPEVIKPEQVKFYTNAPGDYIVKGNVTATSKPNMTSQEIEDYLVQQARLQAARMGANGVLILGYTGKGASETVDVYRNGRYIPVPAHTKTVNAQAIYIRRKTNP
jgi:hypothetical protein